MDPADRAIEIVTGIIVRLEVRIGCKRFSDSSSEAVAQTQKKLNINY